MLSYNIYGIRISIGLIIISALLRLFPHKPRFLIPSKVYNQKKHIFFHAVIIFTLVLTILIPINLRLVIGKKIIKEKFIPIQIVFDVSLSMTADDIQPSRFVAAKESVTKLMQKLDEYYTSVIIFSGLPFIYIPFSNETNAIIDKRKTTNLGDFPPTTNFVGTAIGDALLLAINNLEKINNKVEGQPGLIILLTDGDSNKGYDPLDVIPIAQKRNIPVFVLGIGEQNYIIGSDHRGNSVQAKINIPLLQEIAKETGGDFWRVLETQTFDQIFSRIATMIKAQEKERVENEYIEFNDYFLVLLGICLMLLIGVKIYVISTGTKGNGQGESCYKL